MPDSILLGLARASAKKKSGDVRNGSVSMESMNAAIRKLSVISGVIKLDAALVALLIIASIVNIAILYAYL